MVVNYFVQYLPDDKVIIFRWPNVMWKPDELKEKIEEFFDAIDQAEEIVAPDGWDMNFKDFLEELELETPEKLAKAIRSMYMLHWNILFKILDIALDMPEIARALALLPAKLGDWELVFEDDVEFLEDGKVKIKGKTYKIDIGYLVG